ncbi:lysyl oxidase homolog 3 [Schistocerca cancellata]|uniref:lysyl oxidase homolog 3 n=1 Tax=Schistocerca cancellata TaxID=274614 RepID=UPI002117A46D|nr:lysyl oxidase homolog 3 [Schistocerca cancellata]
MRLLRYCALACALHLASAAANNETATGAVRQQKALQLRKQMRRLRKHEGAVRLVNGDDEHEGNVEVFHFGRWGSVCDDEWDERDAAVVCRQLGMAGAARATHNSHFGQARQERFWMDNLYCTGEESLLSQCRFDGWGSSDCTVAESAGVVCLGSAASSTTTSSSAAAVTPPPADSPRLKIKDATKHKMKVRLVGGRVPTEGRVEVKFGDSEWGTVCGDGWGMLEAGVVCRQLGLGYAADAAQTDFFGGAGRPSWLAGVACRGNEAALDECVHDAMATGSSSGSAKGHVACPGRHDSFAAAVCVDVMADLVIDHFEIMRTAHLEDRQLFLLQCAMEENCVASEAYRIQRDNPSWHLETRRLLRFTARILNAGTADFRPFIPKHLWEFHLCHMHYHSMEVFATFDILDSKGVKVAEGHKASFCLEDNQCMPGVRPFYACANFGDQGISVNCSDIYRHNIDCQWVDISELSPGMYTFKVSINPEFKVAEMTYENNAAVCSLYYSESFAHVFNCTIQRP